MGHFELFLRLFKGFSIIVQSRGKIDSFKCTIRHGIRFAAVALAPEKLLVQNPFLKVEIFSKSKECFKAYFFLSLNCRYSSEGRDVKVTKVVVKNVSYALARKRSH